MKVTGVNHITVNVIDVEVSKAFYENVLGLKQCNYIDLGNHRLTYYQLPQGVLLELIDYDEKDTPVPVPDTHVGMYRHLCLEVDDLDGLYKICCDNGVTIVTEPAYIEKLGRTNMLITDPNGVELEIFLSEQA